MVNTIAVKCAEHTVCSAQCTCGRLKSCNVIKANQLGEEDTKEEDTVWWVEGNADYRITGICSVLSQLDKSSKHFIKQLKEGGGQGSFTCNRRAVQTNQLNVKGHAGSYTLPLLLPLSLFLPLFLVLSSFPTGVANCCYNRRREQSRGRLRAEQ